MKKWSRMKFQPCAPMGNDGQKLTGCIEHINFSRKAATEGMVLLKNENNTLPLKKGSRIAVFGKAQIDYVKGGGGSGDVHCKYVRNIYEGLKCKQEEGKIELFEETAHFYTENLTYGEKRFPGYSIEPEIPEELLKRAAEFADTAVITICRFSGENWDRSSSKGDFYLSEREEQMVEAVCKTFKKVIAVLDVGGVVDSEWFKSNNSVNAALLAWNAGMEGGLAIADILTGDVNPSGKLVDTFAKSFEDYPSSHNYHESDLYVKYYEDIYVGYRYFETIPGADKKVNYPFGFGLSYTEFKLSEPLVYDKNGKIYVETEVENTGLVSGREVIQVYYSAPQGKLGKPIRELAAFQKTPLMNPGEKKSITLEFDINDMASYDDCGKLSKSAYILEQGEYSFFVGTSVRDVTKASFTYNVNEEYRVVKQLSEQMSPFALEKRMLPDGTYEELPVKMQQKMVHKKAEGIKATGKSEKILFSDVANGKETLEDFILQLPADYLADLLGGKPCTGVANTSGIGSRIKRRGTDDYGVPCAMTCDGPAGVRIESECGIYTTAFPCATLLACTWDTDILYETGRIGAIEVKENNLSIWLTPGMNIHRSPLCGRNFEYFSEDPFVAGTMAAAMVKGIQSQNISACIKHFACNNKETYRFNSDSVVSERALREIYLKGFEICVKTAKPWLIMSSYNLINGVRASENSDMLGNILRGEWGYEGAVTTDWSNHAHQGRELLSGNDIRMPSGCASVITEYPCGEDKLPYLQQSAARLLELLLKLD